MMNTPARTTTGLIAAGLLLLLAGCGGEEPASATGGTGQPAAATGASVTQDGIEIAGTWLRPAPQGMAMSAGYGTITNGGTEADTLIAVSTPLADAAELHQSLRENGVATMRPVERLEVMPGETVSLAPGGYHLMLIGLTGPIEEGERYEVTLRFEKAGDIIVPMTALSAGNGMSGE